MPKLARSFFATWLALGLLLLTVYGASHVDRMGEILGLLFLVALFSLLFGCIWMTVHYAMFPDGRDTGGSDEAVSRDIPFYGGD